MNVVEKSTGTFQSFDGCPIYYEVRGDGPAIIFVYGIACLMNHWHHQMDYFSSHYKVVTFDLRGHHRSGTPANKENLDVSSIAKDVLALMNHLNIDSAHLAGHSFGVPVILECGARFPERIRSLACINGFANNPIKGMFGLDFVEPLYHFIRSQYDANPALWGPIWKASIHNPLSQWVSGLVGGFNLKLTQFKDIEIYTRGVAQIPLDVFLPMFENLMKFDGRELAKTIKAPTLILAGEKDFVTPLKFQEDLASLIHGAEYVVVPYGSHCTQLDFPDYINLKLENHFQKNNNSLLSALDV